MQNCQGTFNYIFSSLTRERLTRYHLLAHPQYEKEIAGIRLTHIWLTTKAQPFCVEYREIIDEDLSESFRDKSLAVLCPGFLEPEHLPSKAIPSLVSPYRLKAMLIQEDPGMKERLKNVLFPCEIIWANPEKENLEHQLSYKKIFPFWALILECETLEQVPHKEELVYLESWHQHKALWLQQETISWDLLFIEAQSPRDR
ncbi:MAG: hypothetical protein KUL82_03490 [Bdellovibrio sp.]|nr:hypothetical protein [Bdellovibrio sp.]